MCPRVGLGCPVDVDTLSWVGSSDVLRQFPSEDGEPGASSTGGVRSKGCGGSRCQHRLLSGDYARSLPLKICKWDYVKCSN